MTTTKARLDRYMDSINTPPQRAEYDAELAIAFLCREIDALQGVEVDDEGEEDNEYTTPPPMKQHAKCRPTEGSNLVFRLTDTGEWITDDGAPGLAFSGKGVA